MHLCLTWSIHCHVYFNGRVPLACLQAYSLSESPTAGDDWDREGRCTLTVKIQGPADLAGAVLLRAEANNFCQRFGSSMFRALFETVGVHARLDEYFYREKLNYKPKSLLEQAVLALGDPLVPVVNAFDVDEIIETWDIRKEE